MKYIKGDLIKLAKEGHFDIIAHGCNCFCEQKNGIAKQMSEIFDTSNPFKFSLENERFKGLTAKLGFIEIYALVLNEHKALYIVNMYTQFYHKRNNPNPEEPCFDMKAFKDCLVNLDLAFSKEVTKLKLGLPKIGSGLAGGDWEEIEKLLKSELTNFDVTIVEYSKDLFT